MSLGSTKWCKRAAFALGSLAVAIGLAELGLRVARFQRPTRAYVGEFESRSNDNFVVDEVTGWRMRPEHVFEHVNPAGERIVYRSDALGFRRGRAAEAGDSAPLLAVAGDSFAWGFDVQHEQAFGTLFAHELGAWRLANVAMPGFGLDQIWLSVREQALPLRPNLLVVAIFRGDFERSLTAFREMEGFAKPLFALHDGELVRQTPDDAPGRLSHWLASLRISQFATAASRSVGRWMRVGGWWNLNAAILDHIQRDCAAAEVPVVFVFIPDDHWTPFPSLRDRMRELSANFIDPTEIEPTQPAALYFENTGNPEHLDADGHAFISALLSRWAHDHPEVSRKSLVGARGR
jgi:hypothetical protein